MPDQPTPPPDRPLPEQSRARIRSELLAAADARRTGPPVWVVPGVAAAAVLLVAALAAWAVQAGPDGSDDGGPAVAPSSETASESPAETSSRTPSPTPSEPETVTASHHPRSGGQVGTGSCDVELENTLPGAAQVAAFGDGDTSFWVDGGRFVLCDARMGETTVHHPLPLVPADRVETYRVSSIAAPGNGSGYREIRVAGGVVPDGATAFDVAYTFPDGQTVHSETVDGGGHTWWRVVHTYNDDGNETNDDPIRVVVSWSGTQQTYTLQWGLDTCAQANHGC